MHHKIFHRWSPVLLDADHRRNHLLELVGVDLRYSINFAKLYFVGKLYLIGCFKGSLEAWHLIDTTACRPYITLFIIPLFLNLFWTHVVRRPNMSVSEHWLITHNSRQSEVTQFDVLISVKEYISWFQISVNDPCRVPCVVFPSAPGLPPRRSCTG